MIKFINLKIFQKRSLTTIAAYLFAIVLTLIIILSVTGVEKTSLSIPFMYDTDTLFFLSLIKGLVHNEWLPFTIPHSSFLGMPFGFSLGDYPEFADSSVIFIIMKCIAVFTKDYVKVYNYYSLLTFFLATICFIWTVRYYKLPFSIGISLGLIYSFLDYHIVRIYHFETISYYFVPIMTLVLLWIWSAKPIFFKLHKNKYLLNIKNKKAIFSLLFLPIASSLYIYYSFYFCIFALIAGISAYYYRKNIYHLFSALILMVIVFCSVSVNLLPNTIYGYVYGHNSSAMIRELGDSEIYGLKISQLVLPVDKHRIYILEKIKDKYNNKFPLINENTLASLGIVTSIGFLFLLFNLIKINNNKSVFNKLSILTLVSLLYATVGGFSSIFALFVSDGLRSHNRIVVFIAAFSLISLAFLLNSFRKKINKKAYYSLIILMVVIGVFDQTSYTFNFNKSMTYASTKYVDYFSRKQEFLSDRDFVQKIEKIAPKGGKIFQLPALSFPGIIEKTDINTIMNSFNGFRAELHSDNLKWSYGSIIGRSPIEWYYYTANSPNMVNILLKSGFSGIYIDRKGYSDYGKRIENQLSEVLKQKPIVSEDKRLSYFNLKSIRN